QRVPARAPHPGGRRLLVVSPLGPQPEHRGADRHGAAEPGGDSHPDRLPRRGSAEPHPAARRSASTRPLAPWGHLVSDVPTGTSLLGGDRAYPGGAPYVVGHG